eukprot:356111-Chlamydomonas_euryale.AAC.8
MIGSTNDKTAAINCHHSKVMSCNFVTNTFFSREQASTTAGIVGRLKGRVGKCAREDGKRGKGGGKTRQKKRVWDK